MNSRDGKTMASLSSEAAAVVGPAFGSSWSAARLPYAVNKNMSSTSGALDCQTCGDSCLTADSNGHVYQNNMINTTSTWNPTTKILTTGNGTTMQFNSAGVVTSTSGSVGAQATIFTYDPNFPDRPTQVEDAQGDIWSYGVEASSPGPSWVVNPSSDREAQISYWKSTDEDFNGGEGLPKTIAVKRKSGASWLDDSQTDYVHDHDNSNMVSSVTETKVTDDPYNPDVTTTQIYYAGGKVSEVTVTKNSTIISDTTYSYPSDENVGGHDYGVTVVRVRKTPGY